MNPYDRSPRILSPLRMPIPPPRHAGGYCIPSSQGLHYTSAVDSAATTPQLDGDDLCEVCRVAAWPAAVDVAGTRLCSCLRVEDLCLTDASPDARLTTGVDLPVEVPPRVDVADEVCRVELAESAVRVVADGHVVYSILCPVVLHFRDLLEICDPGRT